MVASLLLLPPGGCALAIEERRSDDRDEQGGAHGCGCRRSTAAACRCCRRWPTFAIVAAIVAAGCRCLSLLLLWRLLLLLCNPASPHITRRSCGCLCGSWRLLAAVYGCPRLWLRCVRPRSPTAVGFGYVRGCRLSAVAPTGPLSQLWLLWRLWLSPTFAVVAYMQPTAPAVYGCGCKRSPIIGCSCGWSHVCRSITICSRTRMARAGGPTQPSRSPS